MLGRPADLDRLRPLALFGLLLTGPALGAVLGAMTNSINGAVSPVYFRAVMNWSAVTNIWRASIAQGIYEGVLFGLGMAVLYAVVVGIVARGCAPYRLALVYLLAAAGFALTASAAGGLVALGLAALSPEYWQNTFAGAPAAVGPLLRYAWVGGSIWGLQFGGLAGLIVACVTFAMRWRRLTRTAPWDPELRIGVACPQCGYDVRGLAAPRCPECGTDLGRVGVRIRE